MNSVKQKNYENKKYKVSIKSKVSFEKINSNDKPFIKLIKREKIQINKITDQRETLQQTLKEFREL